MKLPVYVLCSFLLDGCNQPSPIDRCICGDGSGRFCNVCKHVESACPRIKRIYSDTNITCKPCVLPLARKLNEELSR